MGMLGGTFIVVRSLYRFFFINAQSTFTLDGASEIELSITAHVQDQ